MLNVYEHEENAITRRSARICSCGGGSASAIISAPHGAAAHLYEK